MGVYRGWLVYCHSRPVVTCWAPSVGRRDMTINTAPSMICHSSHITQTKHQATKSIWDLLLFLFKGELEFGSAQSRHHMVETENEFDSNGQLAAVQALRLQEGQLSGVNITRKRPMTGFSEHVFASHLASITWSKISVQELFGHREVSQEHMVPWPGYHCHLCVIWSVVILSIFKTLRFSLKTMMELWKYPSLANEKH